jgi:DNA-binding protein YbaB
MSMKTDKKYEILSAYIDEELSSKEIEEVEKKLLFSKEWQDKYAELRKLKNTVRSSVKSIPENPYFETRLKAALQEEKSWYKRSKKFTPVLGLALATIALMFVLKYNPNIIDNIVEQQKTHLADFYQQNLKPLLYAADLTNEDIFNFAFYHQLPLDRSKKQFLELGSDQKGGQFVVIKNDASYKDQNNLAKFVKGLNLSAEQKMQMDSILSTYAKDLESQVLVNEKHTVAVNPNLWNYNKALMADLISFAAKVNKKQFANVIPGGLQLADVNSSGRLIKQVKSAGGDSYIFLTPDTIFSGKFYFDEAKFNKDMQQMQKELSKNMDEMGKGLKDLSFSFRFDTNLVKSQKGISSNGNFNIYVDSNSYTVSLPNINIPQIPMPDFNNMTVNLNKVADLLKSFSFQIPANLGKDKNFNFNYEYNDSLKSFKFHIKGYKGNYGKNYNSPQIDSMYTAELKRMGMNPDSLSSLFENFFGDSTNAFQNGNIEKQMQQFHKEMERFQKELKNLEKKLNKNGSPKQPPVKNSIEI